MYIYKEYMQAAEEHLGMFGILPGLNGADIVERTRLLKYCVENEICIVDLEDGHL